MKKKLLGIFVCMLLITTAITAMGITSFSNDDDTNNNSISFDLLDADEYCAGIVATGDCVKDGRSIFWKQRHVSDPTGNKPYFFSGTNYKYFGTGVPGSEVKMAMNEAGLAIGSFTANSPTMSPENRQFTSDKIMGTTTIRKYVLGTYSTVSETAYYIAQHLSLSEGKGVNMGIVSSELGVGAVVSVCNDGGNVYGHITWVNNTWTPIDNRLHCEGICQDPDGNGQTIYDIWTDITTNGGSSDGDTKITWEDICHLGAKSVSNKELGEGTFSTYGEISRATSVGALVAVSGDPRYDGALNIGWLQLGRQALVGTFLTLSAYCLSSTSDIPHQYRDGDGIEDYVDSKVLYATNGAGQGSNTYYCERVREIQVYANHNERYMFDAYETIVDNIPPEATPSEVESIIESFVEEMVPLVLSAYESETFISNTPPNKPETPSGSTNGKTGTEYTYSTTTTDPDRDQIYYFWDWDDGTDSGWLGPYNSCETTIAKHTWSEKGSFKIKVKAKDVFDFESDWATLEVEMPVNQQVINPLLQMILERFSNAFPILRYLLGL